MQSDKNHNGMGEGNERLAKGKRSRSQLILRVIVFVVVAAIFFFMARSLAVNSIKVRDYEFAFRPGYLLLSFSFPFAAILWYGVVWKRIVDILEPGNTVSIPFAISTYVYSWLGRYVPGKVVPIAGKIYLARDQNVSREALYLSSILDVIFSILSGFILSVVFLVSAGSGLVQGSLLLFVAIIAGVSIVTLFLADSRPFYHGVNYLLGMMERSRIETTPRLSLANRSLIILLFAVGQMMRGIGFYFFVLSLTPDAQNAPLYVMGIFVLAGALGAASFFVPAGLGVRDGVLAVGLKGCVPFEIATILAVTSRIWETVTDLLLLVIISAVTHGIALVKKHRS